MTNLLILGGTGLAMLLAHTQLKVSRGEHVSPLLKALLELSKRLLENLLLKLI